MDRDKWLKRRDRRLLDLMGRVGPFAYWDRVYESWVALVREGCFIPERNEKEAWQRVRQ